MSKLKKALNQKQLPKPALPASPTIDTTDESEDVQERFERELCWCVEQLNITLSETDPQKKKYSEHLRALQTLQSPKASMVKKRQVMSVTLGNYRDKMKQQESKFMADCMRKTKLQASDTPMPRSVFLKKTASSGKNVKNETSSPSQFHFGFIIDEEVS